MSDSYSDGESSLTSDSETDEGTDTEATDSGDSDLDDLYASFDYESDADSQLSASLTQVGETQIAPTIPTLSVKNSLLYPDVQLTISQSRLLVFQYSLRHSLTKKVFTEFLQLLSVHLPPKSCMPTSVHKLKQVIIEEFPEVTVEEHHYCTFCHFLF